MRQVDIGSYFGIECRVCQNLIEVLSAKAGLFRNFLQHSLITNRPGLLPVRLHDGLMEDCSLPLRFSIFLNNESGTTIDAKWAPVYIQAVLFARPLLQHRT
jgi:hypothetical protein